MPPNDTFPVLQSCTKLAADATVWDVKFYPFGTIDDDQIFAAAAERDTFVCRPKVGPDQTFEILRWFRDEDPEASANSLAWARNPDTGKPWLCIAGATPRHIEILDIETGETVRSLSGHGRGVNDLAISPVSSSLLASCAEDTTIRLWNLESEYEDQPCVAILAGEGHKWPMLAIHFHPNGQWLLSGAMDTAVCLWAVPTAEQLDRTGNTRREPITVYYPHFFTKELHSQFVDSLSFFGDNIVSRASKSQDGSNNKINEIVVWRIEGFNSNEPPVAEPPRPEPGRTTRSSFTHNSDAHSRGFQRLVTLDMPHTDRFYHRFGVLNHPEKRPILAMGNQASQFYFWDLQKLEEGLEPREAAKAARGRQKTTASASESLAGSTPRSTPTLADRGFSNLADRLQPVKPHHKVTVNTGVLAKTDCFATSQVAWSPDGAWMVGVGDRGMMCIFHRDRKAGAKDSVPAAH